MADAVGGLSEAQLGVTDSTPESGDGAPPPSIDTPRFACRSNLSRRRPKPRRPSALCTSLHFTAHSAPSAMRWKSFEARAQSQAVARRCKLPIGVQGSKLLGGESSGRRKSLATS